MSADIDMSSYSGELNTHPAAGEAVEMNSYANEVNEPSIVQQQLLTEPTDAVNAPGTYEQQPLAQEMNFKAIRDELSQMQAKLEQERRDHQSQIDLLRANQVQRPEPIPVPTAKRMFDGMQDEDIPNVAELRREWNEREAAYRDRLEELSVQATHPDYAEVVEKFALPLVKSKPHLAEGIQGASNKAMFAYELGKLAQQIQQTMPSQQTAQPPTQQERNAQRIVENARKPGTLSNAGGQNALSKADYFASMSDKEFMEFANRNLEDI